MPYLRSILQLLPIVPHFPGISFSSLLTIYQVRYCCIKGQNSIVNFLSSIVWKQFVLSSDVLKYHVQVSLFSGFASQFDRSCWRCECESPYHWFPSVLYAPTLVLTLLDAIAPLHAVDQFVVACLRFTLLFLGECLTCQSVYASEDLQELHC